jgi:hypothetical protein
MKGGVGFMSQMHGNTGYQSATVMRYRASAGVCQNQCSNSWAQVMSPSPGPTMKKQNSHHEPTRRNL